MYCLKPKLAAVPKGHWFCDLCINSEWRRQKGMPTTKRRADDDEAEAETEGGQGRPRRSTKRVNYAQMDEGSSKTPAAASTVRVPQPSPKPVGSAHLSGHTAALRCAQGRLIGAARRPYGTGRTAESAALVRPSLTCMCVVALVQASVRRSARAPLATLSGRSTRNSQSELLHGLH